MPIISSPALPSRTVPIEVGGFGEAETRDRYCSGRGAANDAGRDEHKPEAPLPVNYTGRVGACRAAGHPKRQNFKLNKQLKHLEAGSGIEPLYTDLQSSRVVSSEVPERAISTEFQRSSDAILV
jgi:hypothetical protein